MPKGFGCVLCALPRTSHSCSRWSFIMFYNHESARRRRRRLEGGPAAPTPAPQSSSGASWLLPGPSPGRGMERRGAAGRSLASRQLGNMGPGRHRPEGAPCPGAVRRVRTPSPDPRHTGPSVMPSRARPGALSAAGRSSFFTAGGPRKLT